MQTNLTQPLIIHVIDSNDSGGVTPGAPDTGFGLLGNLANFIINHHVIIIVLAALVALIVLAIVAKRGLITSRVKNGLLAGLTCLALAGISVPTAITEVDAADLEPITVTIDKAKNDTVDAAYNLEFEHDATDYVDVFARASDDIGGLLGDQISLDIEDTAITTTDQLVYTSPDPVATGDNLDLGYSVNIGQAIEPGYYNTNIEYTVDYFNLVREMFKLTVNTGTGTTFAIPTSGYVGGASNHAYDWVVNCGGGQSDQVATGASSTASAGIACNYDVAGEYQITIEPNGEAADGWMNAFGFFGSIGANIPANKNMLRTIDTPLPKLSRTKGSTHRFANMFSGARNAVAIPSDLFSLIDTTGDTNVSNMFAGTFSDYAYNSTTAAIPTGLFDSISTSSATNFTNMFSGTFGNFAYVSTNGAIPSGLFSSIDTSNGIEFTSMFAATFYWSAVSSTAATIPAGLFDSIHTNNGNDFRGMFRATFDNYARSSTVGTIPAGLFDSIDTSNGVLFGDGVVHGMFTSTFHQYAIDSTVGTIPAGLFSQVDTSNGTDLSLMFLNTFSNYAYHSTIATIPAGLFDSIHTGNATNLGNTFATTFEYYAINSTVGTIPSGLFDSIDASGVIYQYGMYYMNSMFSKTFYYYANANTLGGTPDTNINDIWGNANFAGKVTASNAGGTSGVFYQTFTAMPSLTGAAMTFINTKLGGINPSVWAGTFSGTGITDYTILEGTGWRFVE